MSRFRRRGRDDETPDDATDAVDEETSQDDSEAEDSRDASSAPGRRTEGPWDVSEVDDPADGRVSLGALWIPGRPGLEVRVEADPTTNVVIAVVLVMGTSALQVQPFAAPRSEGIWTDVRTEIKAGITKDGGTADEVEGPFGPELRTNLQVKGPDGRSAGAARPVHRCRRAALVPARRADRRRRRLRRGGRRAAGRVPRRGRRARCRTRWRRVTRSRSGCRRRSPRRTEAGPRRRLAAPVRARTGDHRDPLRPRAGRLTYAAGMSAHSPGVVRRTLSRLATSAKEHEAAELREGCVDAGPPWWPT